MITRKSDLHAKSHLKHETITRKPDLYIKLSNKKTQETITRKADLLDAIDSLQQLGIVDHTTHLGQLVQISHPDVADFL